MSGHETSVSAEPEQLGCSIDAALSVIGDRWSLLILRDMFKGIRRFEEIQRDLGIGRAVLTERLKRLVDQDVLERRLYEQRPPRYEYRLTTKGRELSPILVALMQWGDKWMGDGEPPVHLMHKTCGTEVSLDFYCWECASHFGAADITNSATDVTNTAADILKTASSASKGQRR